ncbi:MAG: hypothetical protein M1831_000008 [Alyxoria varia]|nr:MAG: hypothetical protein M1831_000008 [Alyxoria varia]
METSVELQSVDKVPAAPKITRLLDLPGELRNEIWKYCVADTFNDTPEHLLCRKNKDAKHDASAVRTTERMTQDGLAGDSCIGSTQSGADTFTRIGLLLVCRQTSQECAYILYRYFGIAARLTNLRYNDEWHLQDNYDSVANGIRHMREWIPGLIQTFQLRIELDAASSHDDASDFTNSNQIGRLVNLINLILGISDIKTFEIDLWINLADVELGSAHNASTSYGYQLRRVVWGGDFPYLMPWSMSGFSPSVKIRCRLQNRSTKQLSLFMVGTLCREVCDHFTTNAWLDVVGKMSTSYKIRPTDWLEISFEKDYLEEKTSRRRPKKQFSRSARPRSMTAEENLLRVIYFSRV